MSIPPASDSRWKEVVQGEIDIDIEFFPLKLLLARQRLQLRMSSDPETIEKCAEELRQMFLKNRNHPIARKDLKKIFGRRRGILHWLRRR
ncbi:MAG: hypothetical protein GF308_20155 [Candidatus Heimdallarchaeota archaeon]|nr:hypothetical protein [Candidatus Heimdallarchaeota archaeon]